MYCRVCNNEIVSLFSHEVLRKYQVQYYLCKGCGLIQTEKPYWLDEAYSEVIADADTGLVSRNIIISHKLTFLLFQMFGTSGRYVDVAGGTGLLTRLMRDIGFNYYWHDQYCANVHARGFEFSRSIGPCSAITAFEVLEHLEEPVPFIVGALDLAQTDTFVFSTELYNGKPPLPDDWWFYSFETGQHISFYQVRTIRVLAERLGMFWYSHNNLHMFTKQPFTLKKFRLCTGRFGKFFSLAIRRRIDSRTMDDHTIMLQKSSKIRKNIK